LELAGVSTVFKIFFDIILLSNQSNPIQPMINPTHGQVTVTIRERKSYGNANKFAQNGNRKSTSRNNERDSGNDFCIVLKSPFVHVIL